MKKKHPAQKRNDVRKNVIATIAAASAVVGSLGMVQVSHAGLAAKITKIVKEMTPRQTAPMADMKSAEASPPVKYATWKDWIRRSLQHAPDMAGQQAYDQVAKAFQNAGGEMSVVYALKSRNQA